MAHRPRAESPSAQKIQALSDRLNGLQSDFRDEKQSQSKKETPEMRIRAFDEQLCRAQVTEETKFKFIKDQIEKVRQGLGSETMAREILEERTGKELRVLESNVSMDIETTHQALRDIELKCEKLVESQMVQVKDELLREQSARENAESDCTRVMGEEISRFEVELDRQRQSRVQKGDKLQEAMDHEFQKITDGILHERKQREEQQTAIANMLQDSYAKFQAELEVEMGERTKTQEQILKLLEETCSRVESSYGVGFPMESAAQDDITA